MADSIRKPSFLAPFAKILNLKSRKKSALPQLTHVPTIKPHTSPSEMPIHTLPPITPKPTVTSVYHADPQSFLDTHRGVSSTRIIAAHSNTSLCSLFGDLDVKSIKKSLLLPESKQSAVKAATQFFKGIDTLIIYGHTPDADWTKAIQSISQIPPTLSLFDGLFTIHLPKPVSIIFLNEPPTSFLPTSFLPTDPKANLMPLLTTPSRPGALDYIPEPQSELVCSTLLRIFDHLSDENKALFFKKPFVKKLVNQIRLEQEWDMSPSIEEFHVAKACSSILLKELRQTKSRADYLKIKKELFAYLAPSEPRTQIEKDLIDIEWQRLHTGASEPMPDIRCHDFLPILAKVKSESAPPPTRSERVAARHFRKMKRLELKLKYHSMVAILGPTGTGKSEIGLNYVRQKFGEIVDDPSRTDRNLFRITAGENADADTYVGTMAISKSRSDTVAFEKGIITQFAESKVPGRLLLIDEATLHAHWGILNSIINEGTFTANGVTIHIEGHPAILLTGNSSNSGQYAGRFPIDSFVRTHGVLMSKTSITADELAELILKPCLTTLHPSRAEQMSDLFISLYQTLQKGRISTEQFGVRELRDAASLATVFVSKGVPIQKAVTTACYRVLSQSVSPLTYKRCIQTLKLTPDDLIFTPPGNDIFHLIQEREGMIHDNVFGRKQGLILPNIDATYSALDTLRANPDVLFFSNDLGYAELETMVSKAYAEGKRLIIDNSRTTTATGAPVKPIATEILESLLNEKMTELKPGFGIYLIVDQTSISSLTPALKSRFMAVQSPGLDRVFAHLDQPSVPADIMLPTSDHDVDLAEPLPLDPMNIPTPLIALSANTNDPLNPKEIAYFNHPSHRNSYNRREVITKLSYPTLEAQSTLPAPDPLSSQPKLDPDFKFPDTHVPIALSYDSYGFARIPSYSCDQLMSRYNTDTGTPLVFYKDSNTDIVYVRAPELGDKPSLLYLDVDPSQPIKTITSWDKSLPTPPLSACPKDLETALPPILRLIPELAPLLNPDASVQDKFDAIRHYVHTFTPTVPGTPQSETEHHSFELLEHLMTSKKGVCLTTAIIGKTLCDYVGIPARLIANPIHAWLEVALSVDGTGQPTWYQFETRASASLVPQQRAIHSPATHIVQAQDINLHIPLSDHDLCMVFLDRPSKQHTPDPLLVFFESRPDFLTPETVKLVREAILQSPTPMMFDKLFHFYSILLNYLPSSTAKSLLQDERLSILNSALSDRNKVKILDTLYRGYRQFFTYDLIQEERDAIANLSTISLPLKQSCLKTLYTFSTLSPESRDEELSILATYDILLKESDIYLNPLANDRHLFDQSIQFSNKYVEHPSYTGFNPAALDLDIPELNSLTIQKIKKTSDGTGKRINPLFFTKKGEPLFLERTISHSPKSIICLNSIDQITKACLTRTGCTVIVQRLFIRGETGNDLARPEYESFIKELYPIDQYVVLYPKDIERLQQPDNRRKLLSLLEDDLYPTLSNIKKSQRQTPRNMLDFYCSLPPELLTESFIKNEQIAIKSIYSDVVLQKALLLKSLTSHPPSDDIKRQYKTILIGMNRDYGEPVDSNSPAPETDLSFWHVYLQYTDVPFLHKVYSSPSITFTAAELHEEIERIKASNIHDPHKLLLAAACRARKI